MLHWCVNKMKLGNSRVRDETFLIRTKIPDDRVQTSEKYQSMQTFSILKEFLMCYLYVTKKNARFCETIYFLGFL